MGVALLIAALTAATLLLFLKSGWWLPDAISAHAQSYDAHLKITLWLIGAVFVAAQLLLAWAALRYRDRNQTPDMTTENRRLEWIWTSVTAATFIGLAVAGQGIWAGVHLTGAAPALRVEVMAKQFAWSYRYPGADGFFGRTSIREVNDAAGNPFGVEPGDPAGKDDIVSALLRVPAGRPIELQLKSRDVIHNFFVRELRLKQDVVPGMTIPLRFQADRPGRYEIPCSELCGLGHHQMRSVLVVMTPEAFEDWMAEERQKAAAAQ